MLRIMFNGYEVGRVNANRSMTLEEAVYCGLGIDITDPEDCRKAYEDGAEYAYLDDCGNYAIDIEAMTLTDNVGMTDKLFNKIWKDALAQPDKELYISEYGYPEWFDEISTDPNGVVDVLCKIHEVAHMSVKDMVKNSGISQAKFSEKFCIPKRTVESWCMEERKCPDYVRLMIARQLGYLEVQS